MLNSIIFQKVAFEKLENRHSQIITMVEQVRFEQELLTKTVGSQNKLSKAIEFARAGSSIDDIVQRAGISVDEAKAVAVEALPVKAPTNVVEVKTPELGL